MEYPCEGRFCERNARYSGRYCCMGCKGRKIEGGHTRGCDRRSVDPVLQLVVDRQAMRNAVLLAITADWNDPPAAQAVAWDGVDKAAADLAETRRRYDRLTRTKKAEG